MSIPYFALYHDFRRAAQFSAAHPDDDGSRLAPFLVQTIAIGAILFLANSATRQMLRDSQWRPPGRSF